MDDLGELVEILAREVADLSERMEAMERRLERRPAALLPAERAHLNRLIGEYHRPPSDAPNGRSQN